MASASYNKQSRMVAYDPDHRRTRKASRIDADTWQSRKPRILYLYVEQNKTLERVIVELNAEQFSVSRHQLVLQLQKWGVRKQQPRRSRRAPYAATNSTLAGDQDSSSDFSESNSRVFTPALTVVYEGSTPLAYHSNPDLPEGQQENIHNYLDLDPMIPSTSHNQSTRPDVLCCCGHNVPGFVRRLPVVSQLPMLPTSLAMNGSDLMSWQTGYLPASVNFNDRPSYQDASAFVPQDATINNNRLISLCNHSMLSPVQYSYSTGAHPSLRHDLPNTNAGLASGWFSEDASIGSDPGDTNFD
ncbi:hypothetical protein LTR70_001024 [Exophiala xenobiotica]|uniref:Clr5 domain-containing protein n=1 Tax=Lithohypha guttulata TaxID=1690604 RepID=A0ABR0KMY6_9EURO|nr:hypothetical protein LTR24_000786 [Lithohypha guttulata]KAK5328870.1 hypothetical protein LTR70_001024 [Exophiala xenobiotica]